MADPISTLKAMAATKISPPGTVPFGSQDMPGSAPKPWADAPIEGLLGAIGVGRDTPANRFGQMAGAAIPFLGEGNTLAKGIDETLPTITHPPYGAVPAYDWPGMEDSTGSAQQYNITGGPPPPNSMRNSSVGQATLNKMGIPVPYGPPPR